MKRSRIGRHLKRESVVIRQWPVGLYATAVDKRIAVPDADRVMPPKSTWLEPKLRDGLFVHMLICKNLYFMLQTLSGKCVSLV